MEKLKIVKKGRQSHEHSLFGSAAGGMLGALFFACALLLLFALIAYKSKDPTGSLTIFSYTALALSSLFCGIVSGRLRRRQAIAVGLVGAVLLLSVLTVLSFAFGGGSLPFWKTVCLYAAVIILSIIGALFTGRPRERKHSIKRQ
ncbi:MAG: TIGR04086 family membrane protein [Clostridia bacterium]|nr:TIGR04086 family membrane protein [Clostridia bacterium]